MKWIVLLLAIPAVAHAEEVTIYCTSPDGERHMGRGFVQDYAEVKDGDNVMRVTAIMTAEHVVSLAGKVEVDIDGALHPCKVAHTDHDRDSAMLMLLAPRAMTPAKLAPRTLRGMNIEVAGKKGQVTEVRHMTVKGETNTVNARVAITTAKAEAGDSGSPILCNGEVVGMLTSRNAAGSIGIDVAEVRAFAQDAMRELGITLTK